MKKLTGGGFLQLGLKLMIFIAIAGSCAKIVSPSGGEKDTEPPVVVKSSPESGTLFFDSKTISVTFNEFVVLDKLNEKFMISPPMEEKPEITLRGKTMRVLLKETPRDSTTYTLYFQDAIRDLNEGNPLPNFKYVFSTGSYLDSLSVTGNVLTAYDLNPPENTLVLLHRNLSDTAPRKLTPDYITLADQQGYFRIDNLRGGAYKLYALGDNNGNKKYDLQDELFAFHDSIIRVTPDKNHISVREDSLVAARGRDTSVKEIILKGDHHLYLFEAPMKQLYLTSSGRSMPYQLQFVLSLPPGEHNFDIEGLEKEKFFTERSRERDTLTVWLLDSLIWSQPELEPVVIYPFTDSAGAVISRKDTIRMRYLTQKTARVKQPERKYSPTLNIRGGVINPGARIRISSATPLRKPDTSQIILYIVKKETRTAIPYSLEPDPSTSLGYNLSAGFAEGENYLLVTGKGAFRSIYGETSDSTGHSFTVRLSGSFGRLVVKTVNANGNVIVQLLDNTGIVLREKAPDTMGEADFPLLERGKYRLRAVYDLNGDGKWSTGDFDIRLQPEPVTYFPDEIDIMTDWIIEEEWDLSRKYEKNSRLNEKKPLQNRR